MNEKIMEKLETLIEKALDAAITETDHPRGLNTRDWNRMWKKIKQVL